MTSTSFLQWKNLTLTHKKTKKQILSNLNGEVRYGEFLTIMGQSGAGKSSLLSILTARLTKKGSAFKIQGQVLMNGENYDSIKFAKNAAYVRQDDILLGTLTVEETFQFQAKLKLHQLSRIEQQFKINQIIKKLNLEQCRKTLIGSQFSKSISGGQRKRVAIGVQLLADPSCIILDQPTSGLDSYNSLKIIKILKKLADDGRAIIATIHQPSSLMFQEMQELMLLGKGELLYMGLAKQIVRYMVQIGIEINIHMNPSDFFMLEVSQFKNSKGYQTPMTAQKFSNYKLQKNEQIMPSQLDNTSQIISNISNDLSLKPKASPSSQIPIIRQFPILLNRSRKNYFRTINNLYGKILVLIIIPLFMIGLYRDVGNQFPEQYDEKVLIPFLTKIGAFLFMFVFFNFGMCVYDTVLTCNFFFYLDPSEKELILKQTSARMYSLVTYYLCRCIIEIPLSVGACIISTTIVYFLTGLEPQFQYFIRFVMITTLVAICGYMFGSIIGIIFTTSQHAIQILPVIIIPLVIFGGLVVNLKTMPAYSSWAQYLSPIRHCYSAIILDQMSTQKMHNIIQFEEVKDLMGVNGQFWINVIYLGIIVGVFSFGSLAGLYIKRKPI